VIGTVPATVPVLKRKLGLHGSGRIQSGGISNSSEAEQVSFEGGSHTLFAQFLMSGLDGYADANCDGIVPAQELAQYIEAQVRKASMDMQRPSAAMPGQLQNLPLARLGAPRCAGISPPDRKGDLRVKLDRFDCKDSPALVQVNGRTAGTICVGGML
jgi:hypothetical protein